MKAGQNGQKQASNMISMKITAFAQGANNRMFTLSK
jgi:hypothetical protein